ncbi:hypothetical protein FRC18_001779 [Serendipita sp. 400]|nr:hypothetical protein FRC18_001779 [Serendipita sp. 400]
MYESITPLVNWHEEVQMNINKGFQVNSIPVDDFFSLAAWSLELDLVSPIAPLTEQFAGRFSSVEVASRNVLRPESIVQETWDTNLTDPYCLNMDPLATFSPPGTTKSLDLAQSFSGLGSGSVSLGGEILKSCYLDPIHLLAFSSLSVPPISNPFGHVHSRRRGERTTVNPTILSFAFTEESPHPDPERRALLGQILVSQFYLRQDHEPQFGSPDAECVPLMAGTFLSLACNAPRKGSIFSLFVDMNTKMCLFCDKTHGSVERVIGCVRKHLGHRPFVCRGAKDGCKSCTELSPARFFAQSLLRDHITRQNKLDKCPSPNCNTSIRIGGIHRHYMTMHPSEPLPDMKTQRKQARRKAHLNTASSVLFSPY